MKLQPLKKEIFNKGRLLLGMMLLLLGTQLSAQFTTLNQRVTDIIIPSDGSVKELYVEVKGGDGGNATVKRGKQKPCSAIGGAGAILKATFAIGNGQKEIPPGSTLRFIRGEKGESEVFYDVAGTGTAGGAGGGGSAILFRRPHNSGDINWEILAASGGGGGAYAGMFAYACTDKRAGKGGNDVTNGDYGGQNAFSKDGGYDGDSGDDSDYGSGGGAGAFISAEHKTSKGAPAQKGLPAGGNGGHCPDCMTGGFGFGGGGFAFYGAGGGGGFSGGGAGQKDGAGGGGGFVYYGNTHFVAIAGSDGEGKEEDGYVRYAFNPDKDITEGLAKRTIQSVRHTSKCLATDDDNIYTDDCNDEKEQKWVFTEEDQSLRIGRSSRKCINLNGASTKNGNNISFKNCNGTWAQKWYYNAVHKTLHVGVDTDKCMEAKGLSTYSVSNANGEIHDCDYDNPSQQWNISGTITAANPGATIRFVPMENQNFAIHSRNNNQLGSGLQLYTLDYSNVAMTWYFDGLQLKMKSSPNLCIDLNRNNVSNGNNIWLMNCNGNDSQKWIYDAFTQSIHLANRPDKCMQIKDGKYEKGADIQIWDCNNTQKQKFLIYRPNCTKDIEPPVAKCKMATLTSLRTPTASDINNGSTDNCTISTIRIDNTSGNTYKLTVTDAAGNSSSCTTIVNFK